MKRGISIQKSLIVFLLYKNVIIVKIEGNDLKK